MKIDLDLAGDLLHLTWSDLKWAIDNNIASPKQIHRYIESSIDHESSSNSWELTSINPNDEACIAENISRYAASEVANIAPQRKWMFLALFLAYERRGELHDALGAIVEIYADFDYPDEMAAIVRYMPPLDGYEPSKHTVLENEQRLIVKWGALVESLKLEIDHSRVARN